MDEAGMATALTRLRIWPVVAVEYGGGAVARGAMLRGRAACSTSPQRGAVGTRSVPGGGGDEIIGGHLPPHPNPLPSGEREQAAFAARSMHPTQVTPAPPPLRGTGAAARRGRSPR